MEKNYKSLNDLDLLRKNNKTTTKSIKSIKSIQSLQSVQSLRSLRSYMKSKEDKKRYLFKFFRKSDLRNEKSFKYKFDLFVLPKNYYLWKGITKGKSYDRTMTMNSFYSNKEVASIYGTKKSQPGTDLQFKIINEIKLFDLGNIDNIKIIFRILDKITYDNLQDKSNKFYSYLRENFETNFNTKTYNENEYVSKCIEMYKGLLVDTTVNLSFDDNKRIKSPTRCERKSCVFFDEDLVKFLKSFDDKFDGWIHFKTDFFHDEILLFDTSKHLKFIDYHLI